MKEKSRILTPSQALVVPKDVYMGSQIVMPEDIPAKEAVRLGLAIPARRSGGKRLPIVPAGAGVFAKFCIKILDKAGKEVAFQHPRTGKMVRRLEGPSHSFTRNFGQFIRGFMQHLDTALNLNETLTDDTGATFSPRLKGGFSGTIAAVSGLAKIKFGNSSAALASTQTNLQGVLLGPTTEAAVAVALTVEDSTNTIFTVTGQITNGSGGAFSVEEMGIFAELGDTAAVANKTTMMLRDLTGTVAVANGQTIIGQYTFTIAV